MSKDKFYLEFKVKDKEISLRNLDELRNNFFIEQIMEHYYSGKLEEWLEVWHYQDELEKVRAIGTRNYKTIAAKLGSIFKVDVKSYDI